MREIKFRLRNKHNSIVGYSRWFEGNEMFHPGWEYAKLIQLIWVHELDGGVIEHCYKDQFTGLKDKYGKEIYEGDIVEISNQNMQIQKMILVGDVIFRSAAFGVRILGVKQWEKYNVNPVSFYWFLNIVDDKVIEVKGNIYENPELMRDK